MLIGNQMQVLMETEEVLILSSPSDLWTIRQAGYHRQLVCPIMTRVSTNNYLLLPLENLAHPFRTLPSRLHSHPLMARVLVTGVVPAH
jgi:hypothetical protein